MSTVSTTGLYAEDLTGTNPANRIVDELQTLQVPGADDYYFIIPRAAPFFVDSLIVKNAQTGAIYKENDDYMYGHRFIEAMDSIGRPIAGSIRFMRRDIVGQVKLTYRTIGGQWGFSDTAILAELSNKQLNPLVRSWAQVDVIPALFPVLEHNQSVDSLIGSKEINDALIRLGDIIEAGSEGTSQSHITNYLNPHRVTKEQVTLGNVPNYLMATDTEARAGTRADLFLSPRGAQLLVQDKAITPMTTHINQTGNVHGMVAADINLGNVPNYRAATAQQAIDVTNNNTLLTPFTAALLIEQLQNVTRVDELENLITAHIADKQNPHEITPGKIGTLTTEEIEERISNASGGGDAATFGGQTPAQWRDGFVAATEIDGLIDKLVKALNDACQVIEAVAVLDTTTPQQQVAYDQQMISGVTAGFDMYFVNNNAWAAFPVQPAGGVFPELILNSQSTWARLEGASYYLTARGSIVATGPNAISPPVGWKEDAAFLPANACNGLWATKNSLYARKRTASGGNGEIRRFRADNTNTLVVTAGMPTIEFYIHNELRYNSEVGVLEYVVTPQAGNTPEVTAWQAYGLPAYAAPVQTILNTLHSGASTIESAAVLEGFLFLVMGTGIINVYRIDRTVPGVPTGVTKVTNLNCIVAGKTVALSTITNAVAASGSYNHVAFLRADGTVATYGDNTVGQAEIEDTAGPFIDVSAGYNFTVTVNERSQTQFWGDSEDNSLYYGGRGVFIDPEA